MPSPHVICIRDMATDFTQYLAIDYGVLRRYLGEVRFNALTSDCIAANPSRNLNASAYSARLPERIASFHKASSELAELAELERALRDAFEATETQALSPDSLLPERLRLHPSVHLISFTQNTLSIWSGLKCDEPPPRPYTLDTPQHVLVWRHNGQPRMRILGDDEHGLLDSIRTRFCFVAGDETSELYLRGWLETEVLAEAGKVDVAK